MRIRTIKPEFFVHDGLADLSAMHRLFFIGLWCAADREGRMVDQPRRLKAQILPYDDVDTGAMIEDLARLGFLVRYEVAGERFLQITAFAKHQRPHARELPSEIPAIPVGFQSGTTQVVPEHNLGSAQARPKTAGREGNGARRVARAEQPGSAKSRRSRFPDDLTLTADLGSLALTAGVRPDDVPREWEKFRNHHTAKGSVMADWTAAWRTWVSRAREFSGRGTAGGFQGSRQSAIDDWVAGAGGDVTVTTAREVG